MRQCCAYTTAVTFAVLVRTGSCAYALVQQWYTGAKRDRQRRLVMKSAIMILMVLTYR
jgi:hypothetical protein